MKYIHNCDITIKERIERACKLTDTEYTEELFNNYLSRVPRLNEFIVIFGIDKDEKIHIPSTRVLREYPTLFTDRSIQRYLGGMTFFRAFMQGEAVDYTKGEERKKIQSIISERSKKHHVTVYNKLVKEYGFVDIHPERPYVIGEEKRCDFYIASKDIYIDIFSTEYPIYSILQIKRKKYKELSKSKNIYYIHNNNDMVKLF